MNGVRPAAVALLLCSAACGTEAGTGAADEALQRSDQELEWSDDAEQGERLFDRETFGGNGRTCRTCHSSSSGALSPQEVQLRFSLDPGDPLFRPMDSDDGAGTSYDRLLQYATILVTIPLPSNVSLKDDPAARSVVLERAVTTTFDRHPALEDVLMADGRESDLATQALHAVTAHMEPGVEPTQEQLQQIATFERERLFSSDALERYARGGPPPSLPAGTTASERRGRKFFEDVPFDLERTGLAGFCAQCHSGPMLNTTNEHHFMQPAGLRVSTAFVSEINARRLPERTFVFVGDDGAVTEVSSPDPGRALITGRPAAADGFRIPSLWGIGATAPYFHDNSAATLEELVAHYDAFAFREFKVHLSEQEQADIVSFLGLL